ncbi:hypothetical protein Bca52824_024754 [Brassica carinata]|uniref:Uncharacterized protein n=1 Tax=Brassica carinata TaxID=52824 RepID=A0A8X8AX24_BRACI|nr:hypothetical protein Bca52824_024754 [Brassica carinata]
MVVQRESVEEEEDVKHFEDVKEEDDIVTLIPLKKHRKKGRMLMMTSLQVEMVILLQMTKRKKLWPSGNLMKKMILILMMLRSYFNGDRVSWWELVVLSSHAHPFGGYNGWNPSFRNYYSLQWKPVE